jgi:predicted ATPase
MIESIEFTNYKALRKTTLPLAPFTLLLGPNGSGKSSVLQALQGIALLAKQVAQGNGVVSAAWTATRSVTVGDPEFVQIQLRVRLQNRLFTVNFQWHWKAGEMQVMRQINREDGTVIQPGAADANLPLRWLASMQTYSLDFSAISQPVPIGPGAVLKTSGNGLAAVLDNLRENPERWSALLKEMCEWLPEYDFIHLDTQDSQKAVALRTKKGQHRIPASELSQGTLVALALLTLAYLPNPPSMIGLEEIDRGLHPRLLRHLQDSLYRLSYPESCGEKQRPPIQVIATTHSPYLLDLYREHSEEVVLAEKEGLEVQFKQLSKFEHLDEILGDGPLSEIWYSGVLGGVSVKP